MLLHMIDVAAARALTPGCERVAHFNNAGTALPSRPVMDAVRRHLDDEALGGGYEAEDAARLRLDAVYDSVARLVGAHADEVALVESATRAWQFALYALPLPRGSRILTSHLEYPSNLISLTDVASRSGATLEVIPGDAHGQTDVAALANMMDGRVALIALNHVPTNSGLVNPAAEVGRIARESGVPLLLDACQSVGQMPVNVDEIGCDMLAATGRKFLRGPRGTGFLYVRRSLVDRLVPVVLDDRSATLTSAGAIALTPGAKRFESLERNMATSLGLGAAAEHAMHWGLDHIATRVQALAAQLRTRLADTGVCTVHDRGAHLSAIVTFSTAGITPPALREAARASGVNLWVTNRPGLGLLSRASPHYYNTDDELDRLVDVVRAAAR